MADDDVAIEHPPVARSGAREWTACRYADVLATLADSRFEVAGPGPAGPVGTLSWLRASVSRFANGAEHRCGFPPGWRWRCAEPACCPG
jgi:hypothetical protein